MKCFKCGKEMEREDGRVTLKGIKVDITLGNEATDEEKGESKFIVKRNTIAYNNLQLGKYSDGNGECHVGICYECYIDGLFK